MRRASWIALGIGALALGAAALLYGIPAGATAPPMTSSVAAAIARQGAEALARKDTAGVLALFTPDAQILGGKTDQLRLALDTAFSQMEGRLTVRIRDVSARMDGQDARAHLVMDVGEHTAKMDVEYFPGVKADLRLVKVRTSRWLGLVSREEWRVAEMSTSEHIVLPEP